MEIRLARIRGVERIRESKLKVAPVAIAATHPSVDKRAVAEAPVLPRMPGEFALPHSLTLFDVPEPKGFEVRGLASVRREHGLHSATIESRKMVKDQWPAVYLKASLWVPNDSAVAQIPRRDVVPRVSKDPDALE